jgi:hypothetical protein
MQTKWASLLIILVMAALIFSGCSDPVSSMVLLPSSNSSDTDRSIQTLDDWTGAADHIVIGIRVGEEAGIYDNGAFKYSFQVEEQLKGKLEDKEIDVYSLQALTSGQNRFMLFLVSTESEYYERTYYTVLYSENAIHEKTIVSGPFKNKSLSGVIKVIRASSGMSTKNENKHQVKEKAENVQELILASDYILQLKPVEVVFENRAIKASTIELIRQFKGDGLLQDRKILTLPQYVKVGEEYLVFL